ncbi:rCG48219 [Rattus norvegicus]|uniref:RCG48219 n=1 Tax=Rattus norvegicus TaxID=10116 RepID=A6HY84_RAT|nr:rCG48219 [Rattus norvegicus]
MLVFPRDGGFPAILTIQLPPSLKELSQDSDKILQAGYRTG